MITNDAFATLSFTGASTAANATIKSSGRTIFQDSASGGIARLIAAQVGSTFAFANSVAVAVGSIEGAGIFEIRGPQLTTGSNNLSTTVSGGIIGTGSLVKIGSGTLTLSGDSRLLFGTTMVNAGAMIVDGALGSSLTTANSGATLGGSGAVGSTTINTGGTFAPGPSGAPGTMTIRGNLAFQSGALYVVQVNPSTSSVTNVSGTAALAGAVQANFAPANVPTRSYTILSATGGRNGTFDSLTISGLPANFRASLSSGREGRILDGIPWKRTLRRAMRVRPSI